MKNSCWSINETLWNDLSFEERLRFKMFQDNGFNVRIPKKANKELNKYIKDCKRGR